MEEYTYCVYLTFFFFFSGFVCQIIPHLPRIKMWARNSPEWNIHMLTILVLSDVSCCTLGSAY